MDWNGKLRVPFISRPNSSFSIPHNYNYDQFLGKSPVFCSMTTLKDQYFMLFYVFIGLIFRVS